MSLVMRKPIFTICKQQRHRSACASAQSDQCLRCLLPRQYNASSFYVRTFKPLASYCGCAGWFVSYMVKNPEDRFSGDEAHTNWVGKYFNSQHKKEQKVFVQTRWSFCHSNPMNYWQYNNRVPCPTITEGLSGLVNLYLSILKLNYYLQSCVCLFFSPAAKDWSYCCTPVMHLWVFSPRWGVCVGEWERGRGYTGD